VVCNCDRQASTLRRPWPTKGCRAGRGVWGAVLWEYFTESVWSVWNWPIIDSQRSGGQAGSSSSWYSGGFALNIIDSCCKCGLLLGGFSHMNSGTVPKMSAFPFTYFFNSLFSSCHSLSYNAVMYYNSVN